ncbi:MAG TPA: 2Fe-2S iron-sulfur cluster-binding protein [Candidatus Sulfotelmatobacter sp.]|nr:2Fe-2S iron-sulfur cluster-binding protein [Candidatus Sulfotelmatobacter sp.]
MMGLPLPRAEPGGAAGPLPAPDLVTVKMDGRRVRIRPGTSLLQAAREAGIDIPRLCHHPALEPSGACRLCVVDIARPEWNGTRKMVTACLYPAEDGLLVFTTTERVRAARRDLLDLLLARCPDTPLIQRLARDHGLQGTSYRPSQEPTDCVLCGLCTRACDHLGFAAISMVSRGIGREVAPPFRRPPADCVGCLACARICPTGHIRYETSDRGRTIWGRTFAMLRCRACGAAHLTVAQAEAWAARTGVPSAYFETCDACKRAATAATMARLGGG